MPDSGAPAASPSLDPESVRLEVNGVTTLAKTDFATQSVTWRPETWDNTILYDLVLKARNLEGRCTPDAVLELARRQAIPLLIDWHASNPEKDGPYLLVLKSKPPSLTGPLDFFYASGDQAPFLTWPGNARLPLTAKIDPPDNWNPNEIFLSTQTGERTRVNVSISNIARESHLFWHILVDPDQQQDLPDGRWSIRRHPGTSDWHPLYLNWLEYGALPAICSARDFPAWLEIRGARPILVDATHRTPWQEPCDLPRDTLIWHPLVPELVGKTIVIDPHGGAADADGTAPMGTPGRELNLRTAERLAALLRGAGAEAVLTRDDPGYVPPEAKVLLTNEADADLFITLRRAAPGDPGWSIAHHYGSAGGSTWGTLLAETLAPFAAPDTIPVAESYAYLLRHTACPAVDVSLPLPTDLDAEELWRAPAYQQAVASALMSATAAWFQGEDLLLSLTDPRTFILEHTTNSRLLNGCDWIRVDGNWLWLPPRSASTPPAKLPLPGLEHTFEVRRGDRWELLVSGMGEGDMPRVWPFWTSESRPTNPFAETDTTHEATGP